MTNQFRYIDDMTDEEIYEFIEERKHWRLEEERKKQWIEDMKKDGILCTKLGIEFKEEENLNEDKNFCPEFESCYDDSKIYGTTEPVGVMWWVIHPCGVKITPENKIYGCIERKKEAIGRWKASLKKQS